MSLPCVLALNMQHATFSKDVLPELTFHRQLQLAYFRRFLTDLISIISAVREFVNKSAASAASPDYVKFQAAIQSAASAASRQGGRAGGRLDHGLFR